MGTDRVPEVESHLASNKKNIEFRYQMLIERSRQRLHLVQSGQLRAADAAEWARHREGDLSARLVLRQGSCRISGFESDHTVGVWLTRE